MIERRHRFCWACDHVVTIAVPAATSIGPRDKPCPRCGALIQTHRREWAEHSAPGRVIYFARAVLGLAMSLVLVCVGAMLVGMALAIVGLPSRAAAWVALCLIPLGASASAWFAAEKCRGEIRESLRRMPARVREEEWREAA